MKRLRTLTFFKIFKSENKKLKTYSGLCAFKGLFNNITLMQIQSGRTVPLIPTHLFEKIPTGLHNSRNPRPELLAGVYDDLPVLVCHYL